MQRRNPKRDQCAPKQADAKSVIFARTIRLKNGRVLRAEDYGLKAFPIRRWR